MGERARARTGRVAGGRGLRETMQSPAQYPVACPVRVESGDAGRRPSVTSVRRSGPTRCEWCGRELPAQEGLGRRRRYCAHSCRQRAYEHRNAVSRGRVPPDAVVLSAEEAADLSDRLYQMRCAAEDVATAVAERAKPVELAGLVGTLLTAARSADRLR